MTQEYSKRIKTLIKQMTLAEKIGQLFMPAYTGHDTDYAKELITTYNVGGFYLSNDNADNHKDAFELTKMLNFEAQKRVCDAPLLLGVDQEGAWSVLSKTSVTGPGNLALGAANDSVLTKDIHQMFAKEMSSVGYNAILGPCADINANPNNPIIGVRAFGESRDLVSKHVIAAVSGLKAGNVISAAKHFPGHGDTNEDTHRKLPSVDKSLDELLEQDLVPFKAAIDAGVDIIMTAHILYPQIDASYPATLSSTILQDILRKKLGFKGIILTDSMNMWAMRKNYEPAEAAILALKAGANIIMLSEEVYENSLGNYKEKQIGTINGVIKAVEDGLLDEAIIDASLALVLNHKYSISAYNTAKVYDETRFATEDHKALAYEASASAIKVLKNDADMWPIRKDGYYLVPTSNPKMQDKILACRGIGPNDERLVIDVITGQLNNNLTQYKFVDYNKIDRFIGAEIIDDYPIILITENYPIAGYDHDIKQQAEIVQQIVDRFGDRVVVIALRSDYEYTHYKNLKTYVCAYSSRPVSATVVADLLSNL
ncbi:MAG: glycoside hydrolase family 3 protein [Ostreibacterium sp.]